MTPEPFPNQQRPVPCTGLAQTVYEHLRTIAQNQMISERPGHTLTATALVHEAYLRLGDDPRVREGGRGAFFCAAAEAMRRILIEHARARGRVKRGGGAGRVPLDAIEDVVDLAALDEGRSECILAFDEAFGRLEDHQPRVADVVRLRFFAGLTVEQTAEAIGVSERTVSNDWGYARAWMARELERHDAGS